MRELNTRRIIECPQEGKTVKFKSETRVKCFERMIEKVEDLRVSKKLCGELKFD
jgi:hypothetical protein